MYNRVRANILIMCQSQSFVMGEWHVFNKFVLQTINISQPYSHPLNKELGYSTN